MLNMYQFVSFSLFVSSFISPIVFGLGRTFLDVLTIFFSFLGSYFHILEQCLCYFHAALVQIMSKSLRKSSETSFTSVILILWRQRCLRRFKIRGHWYWFWWWQSIICFSRDNNVKISWILWFSEVEMKQKKWFQWSYFYLKVYNK